MTKKTFIPVALAALVAIGSVSCNREVQFGKSPIKKVVAAMTLEEKVNLLIGVGAWNGPDIAQEIQDAKNLFLFWRFQTDLNHRLLSCSQLPYQLGYGTSIAAIRFRCTCSRRTKSGQSA